MTPKNHKPTKTGILNRKKMHPGNRFSCKNDYFIAANQLSKSTRCEFFTDDYFLPHEGTNNVAFGLISFENLAAYEAYRERLRADPDGAANFNFAEANRLIQREERTFLRALPVQTGVR